MEREETAQTDGNAPTRLAGQAVYYLFGNAYSLLAGFVLQIYLATELGAAGLGLLALLDAGTVLLCSLMSLGIGQTLVRFIPDLLARGEDAEVRRLIGRGLAIVGVAGLVGYIVAILAIPLGQRVWPEAFASRATVEVFAVLIPTTMVASALAESLRGFGDVRTIVVGSSFVAPTVRIGLAVSLLTLGMGVIGYVWALVAASVGGAVWLGTGVVRKVQRLRSVRSHRQEDRRWFEYARTTYAQTLTGVLTEPADRFLLGRYSDASTLGVAAIAKLLSGLPSMFLQVLLVVLGPMFSDLHAKRASDPMQRLYNLGTDWSVRLAAPAIVFLACFAGPVLRIFGEQFAEVGRDALLILLFGQAVNIACGPVGRVLNMSGAERQMLILGAAHSVLYLVLLIALTPSLGITGIAVSISAATLFLNVAAIALGWRHMRLRWWERRYCRWGPALFGAILIAAILRAVWPWSNGLGLLAAAALTFVAFHAAYLIGALHPDDHQVWLALRERIGGVAR